MIKIKFNVTDSDNEFTEYQTPRKKLQLIGISPVSLHAFMKTLKSNTSEAYKVQVDYLKDSESDCYDKNDMKEKVNDLVTLQKAMQEKLKTASFLKFLKFLPWYLINSLECTVQNILISLNTLFELHMKSKK